MWKLIGDYLIDDDGLGRQVPVAWRRDGGSIVRMAAGFRDATGKWEWTDPFAAETIEQPDFWFDMPNLRRSSVWP